MAKSVPAAVMHAFENYAVRSDTSKLSVECLEAVKRVATKPVACFRNPSYKYRLHALRLTSMYDRRLGSQDNSSFNTRIVIIAYECLA